MENQTSTVFDTTEASREHRGPAGTAMKPEERAELLAASETANWV